MKDEFSDRHHAVKQRLAGQSVETICQTLDRSREWFHTWWRRYQALGAAGLFDLTHARHQPQQISPELERTILNIRQRLESPLHPHTRYSLIGASAIQAELKALQIQPVPCPRTIERVLQRSGAVPQGYAAIRLCASRAGSPAPLTGWPQGTQSSARSGSAVLICDESEILRSFVS